MVMWIWLSLKCSRDSDISLTEDPDISGITFLISGGHRKLRVRFGANEAVDLATRMMKKRMDDEEEFKRHFSSGYKFPLTREYRWTIWAVNVIHSLETNEVRRINCNVKNDGIITNLTQGCCVEVPCLVDKEGVHPCRIGALPPQIAALVQSNVNVQELAVRELPRRIK